MFAVLSVFGGAHARHAGHFARRRDTAGAGNARSDGLGGAGGPVLLDCVPGSEMASSLQVGSPALGPSQTGEEEKEREKGNVDARNRVNVSPEDALALAQARIEHTRQTVGIARPPKEDTGDDHNDGPTGGEFDDPGANVTHEQLAVEFEDYFCKAMVFIIAFDH